MMASRGKLRDSRILVVGGAGFIGSNFISGLCGKGSGRDLVVLDSMFTGRRENIESEVANNNVKLIVDDCEDRAVVEEVIMGHGIDVVFNFATKALCYSFVNPMGAFMTNPKGTLNLLECQRRNMFKTLVNISSSEVYGTAKEIPMSEEHPWKPTTSYAAGKAASDLAVQSYKAMFDLDVLTIRPFNNFGPRQNWEGDLVGVIPKTILRLLKGDKAVIAGNGSQTRDFVYVKDTCRYIERLYEVQESGTTVNIASGETITIRELVSRILKAMDRASDHIEYTEPRTADVQAHLGCTQKLYSLTGKINSSFDENLRDTIQWYKEKVLT